MFLMSMEVMQKLDHNLVSTTQMLVKSHEQIIYTNVALDPYSSDGHDGIVREDGKCSFFDFLHFSLIFHVCYIS